MNRRNLSSAERLVLGENEAEYIVIGAGRKPAVEVLRTLVSPKPKVTRTRLKQQGAAGQPEGSQRVPGR